MKKTPLNPQKEPKETSTPNITPRRGSLPGDFNRPSPRTPRFPTPPTPTTPNFNQSSTSGLTSFSPTLPSFQEVGDTLDHWLGWQNKFQTTQKLLQAKEKEIERLETQKQAWLQEKSELEQTQISRSKITLRKFHGGS